VLCLVFGVSCLMSTRGGVRGGFEGPDLCSAHCISFFRLQGVRGGFEGPDLCFAHCISFFHAASCVPDHVVLNAGAVHGLGRDPPSYTAILTSL
jgi:hypothetical protein